MSVYICVCECFWLLPRLHYYRAVQVFKLSSGGGVAQDEAMIRLPLIQSRKAQAWNQIRKVSPTPNYENRTIRI